MRRGATPPTERRSHPRDNPVIAAKAAPHPIAPSSHPNRWIRAKVVRAQLREFGKPEKFLKLEEQLGSPSPSGGRWLTGKAPPFVFEGFLLGEEEARGNGATPPAFYIATFVHRNELQSEGCQQLKGLDDDYAYEDLPSMDDEDPSDEADD